MVWVADATPWPLYPWEGDLVRFVQEAGWAQGPCGQVQKISRPLGFDPQTIQPVASRYTDYAMLAHIV
jgi:hypothetical protein